VRRPREDIPLLLKIIKCVDCEKSNFWLNSLNKDGIKMTWKTHCQNPYSLNHFRFNWMHMQAYCFWLEYILGTNWFLITDYYSGYLKIIHFTNITANTVGKYYRKTLLFTRWSISDEFVSQHSLQLCSDELAKFYIS